MSAPSLHRESTDSLITHNIIIYIPAMAIAFSVGLKDNKV